MAKYVDANGLKKSLLVMKKYIDEIVEKNNLITSSAFIEIEQMIENLAEEVVYIDEE